ncbi:MAG: hypothetical protein V8S08_09305 [Lachnoclostridium sp.]
MTPAYLFVAVLPCSLYVYAELCPNMKSDTFINCHVHAYAYFGGSTRLLIPDNHKAGVTKNTRYDTLIPRAYKEIADHYNTAIVPARVKHPDDKPNAEGSVKYATTWILAALRNYHFFSIEEAKQPFLRNWRNSISAHLKRDLETDVLLSKMKKEILCCRFPKSLMNQQSGPLQRFKKIIS